MAAVLRRAQPRAHGSRREQPFAPVERAGADAEPQVMALAGRAASSVSWCALPAPAPLRITLALMRHTDQAAQSPGADWRGCQVHFRSRALAAAAGHRSAEQRARSCRRPGAAEDPHESCVCGCSRVQGKARSKHHAHCNACHCSGLLATARTGGAAARAATTAALRRRGDSARSTGATNDGAIAGALGVSTQNKLHYCVRAELIA